MALFQSDHPELVEGNASAMCQVGGNISHLHQWFARLTMSGSEV